MIDLTPTLVVLIMAAGAGGVGLRYLLVSAFNALLRPRDFHRWSPVDTADPDVRGQVDPVTEPSGTADLVTPETMADTGALLRSLSEPQPQRARNTAAARIEFPWGVLAANTIACALSGLAIGLSSSGTLGASELVIATAGVAGGLSTMSSLVVDTARLAESRGVLIATANLAANILMGILTATLAYTAIP